MLCRWFSVLLQLPLLLPTLRQLDGSRAMSPQGFANQKLVCKMLSFTGDGRQKQAASLTAHTGELLPTAFTYYHILTSKVHSFFVSISFPITLQGNNLGPGIAVSQGRI